MRTDSRARRGDPFAVGRDGDREQAIQRYRASLWRRIDGGEVALADLAALDGKRLRESSLDAVFAGARKNLNRPIRKSEGRRRHP